MMDAIIGEVCFSRYFLLPVHDSSQKCDEVILRLFSTCENCDIVCRTRPNCNCDCGYTKRTDLWRWGPDNEQV